MNRTRISNVSEISEASRAWTWAVSTVAERTILVIHADAVQSHTWTRMSSSDRFPSTRRASSPERPPIATNEYSTATTYPADSTRTAARSTWRDVRDVSEKSRSVNRRRTDPARAAETSQSPGSSVHSVARGAAYSDSTAEEIVKAARHASSCQSYTSARRPSASPEIEARTTRLALIARSMDAAQSHSIASAYVV